MKATALQHLQSAFEKHTVPPIGRHASRTETTKGSGTLQHPREEFISDRARKAKQPRLFRHPLQGIVPPPTLTEVKAKTNSPSQ